MYSKRVLRIILIAAAVLLGVGASSTLALPPWQRLEIAGMTIPYSARLTDETGQPVADGAYALSFAFYAAQAGGEPRWSELQEGVKVKDGTLTTALGSVNRIPQDLLDGNVRWLEVGVRGPGETGFTALAPRQRLNPATSAAPDRVDNGVACPHDHFGETWTGSGAHGLEVYNSTGYGVLATSEQGVAVQGLSEASYGVRGESGVDNGVVGLSSVGSGVYGQSTHGAGISGYSEHGLGVKGESVNNYGVQGVSTNSYGVRGETANYVGVLGVAGVPWFTAADGPVGVLGSSDSAGGYGVYGVGAKYGVYGRSSISGSAMRAEQIGAGYALHATREAVSGESGDALYVAEYGPGRAGFFGINNSQSTSAVLYLTTNGWGRGLYVESAGDDGVYVESAGDDGVRVQSAVDYAGLFNGNVFVAGSIHYPRLAYFGVNASNQVLQPGEIVSLHGIRTSQLVSTPMLLQAGPAKPGEPVIGVVEGWAELDQDEDPNSGEASQRLVPREGAVQPGAYVTIITYGPVQIKASTASGAIRMGARLAVDHRGWARALRTMDLNGVQVAESAPTIGIALEETDTEGMIWVLINPQ